LKLVCYRDLKIDSKIDSTVTLEKLENLGLIKPKHNSFILSDSRNFNHICFDNVELIENILKKFEIKNLDLIYSNYLPRCINSYTDDVISHYNSNKKGINQFNKLNLDPLINTDWFIYDDESLNLLTNMSFKSEVEETIKIKNNIIYFQDKLPYITLPNKEYKLFFLSIIITTDVRCIKIVQNENRLQINYNS
jgi:hypothetical protein